MLNDKVYDDHIFENHIIQLALRPDHLHHLHRHPQLIESTQFLANPLKGDLFITTLDNHHLLNLLANENNFSIKSLQFVLKHRQQFG